MFLSALLVAALLQGSQARPAPATPRSDSQATAEGIEILRRILSDQLDDTFATDEREDGGKKAEHRLRMFGGDAHGLVTQLWAGGQTVSHSRGFHVPGHGVLLFLDLSLPTTAREQRAEEPEDTRGSRDDEWERMRQRVRGSPDGDSVFLRGGRLEGNKDLVIDEAAIDRVRETVIKTVARHASRIDGLGSNDTITVALHLSGQGGAWWSNFESPEDEGDTDGEGSKNELGLAQTYVVTAGGEVPEQHLVLEIALADLDEFAQGGYSRLAPRVNVTRY